LKAGLWFRRARLVMLAPDPRHPRRAQAEVPLNDLSEFSRLPLASKSRGFLAMTFPDVSWVAAGFGVNDSKAGCGVKG
jgi:hypothetical protein